MNDREFKRLLDVLGYSFEDYRRVRKLDLAAIRYHYPSHRMANDTASPKVSIGKYFYPTPERHEEGAAMAQDVNVSVKQISASTSECTTRQHHILSDRPEAKGGADRGPMGGEMLLMGLGGCFMSNLLAAVRAREAQVSDLAIQVAGTLAEAPARFAAIRMTISGTYADRAEMEKLVTIAERGCIVANTLKNALQLSLVLA
jgi:putative redox protein